LRLLEKFETAINVVLFMTVLGLVGAIPLELIGLWLMRSVNCLISGPQGARRGHSCGVTWQFAVRVDPIRSAS
jgi:hypothetical protein